MDGRWGTWVSSVAISDEKRWRGGFGEPKLLPTRIKDEENLHGTLTLRSDLWASAEGRKVRRLLRTTRLLVEAMLEVEMGFM